jgi:hypothetical protein
MAEAGLSVERLGIIVFIKTPAPTNQADSAQCEDSKKLESGTRQERLTETEEFVAKPKEKPRTSGSGSSPEWIQISLREALMRDGKAIHGQINYLENHTSPSRRETARAMSGVRRKSGHRPQCR